MANSIHRLWSRIRLPEEWPKSYFYLLLPLLLLLFPRTDSVVARGGSWLRKPFPMAARAIQARRVRVLIRQPQGHVRIDGSSWGVPIAVRFDSGRVELRSLEDGAKLAVASGHRLEAATGRFLRVDGVPYRGAVEVFYNPYLAPVVVNELSMEDYLKGVVPLELGPVQFPLLEAQKVQSVAARTYSLRHLGNFAQRGFDLYLDVRSQVYGGVPAEKELSNLALLQTSGMVAVSAGQPILAYYSSTCGGRTAPASEVFSSGSDAGYLRGGIECPDQSSPYRNWEVSIPIADFRRKLGIPRAKLEGLKEEQFPSGRLRELEILTPAAKRTISGQELRIRLGLRSTWLTQIELSGERVEIQGHGFGHGVGLCQFGSVELARRGQTAEQILEHYYPGSSLQKVY